MAEDKTWWRKDVINLAYVVDMQVDRTIESNDGTRVVELRHFVASRVVELLCEVDPSRRVVIKWSMTRARG